MYMLSLTTAKVQNIPIISYFCRLNVRAFLRRTRTGVPTDADGGTPARVRPPAEARAGIYLYNRLITKCEISAFYPYILTRHNL